MKIQPFKKQNPLLSGAANPPYVSKDSAVFSSVEQVKTNRGMLIVSKDFTRPR